MRSHDGRVAGVGTQWAYREYEDTWTTHAVSVRLPHDKHAKENYQSLSGPVITVVKGREKV